MFDPLLVALAAVLVWAIGVYFFPFRACRKCGGSGRVQRPGSRTLHRAALAVRAGAARERMQRAGRRTAERISIPVRSMRIRER